MASTFRRSVLTALLISGVCFAQTSLILKTHRIETSASQSVLEAQGSDPSGSGHLLIQFDRPPSQQHIADLAARGVTVLADVPVNGLLVSVQGPVKLGGLGITYAAPIAAADKISPLDATNATGFLLVEFYSDVNINDARGMLVNAGATPVDNPDLAPTSLMIQTSDMTLVQTLAQLDAVSYIFPASNELAQGIPMRPCVGALSTDGTTVQSIPTYGRWGGGTTPTPLTLYYYYENVTEQLNATAAKAQIAKAMAEWSSVVKVTWLPGLGALSNQTVNILWATYAHGDAYPFTGPGGVLAHTFYPAPPNQEPIAGDMHLNDSETWQIGANTDLYSVVLHELGHALGLGHSDNPDDVMYPYYKMVSALNSGDIAAIQTLYTAQPGTAASTPAPSPTPAPTPTPTPAPPPTPAALKLTVTPTAATTTASAVTLTGSASGGSGTITVTWSTASSSIAVSGTATGSASAWTISNIALAMGANTITIVATAGSAHVSQVVTITRQAASTPAPPPPPSSGGTETTPPTLTISSPGATSVSTSAATITFSGTASDNVGVSSVTWSTNTGQSGTASGTTSWSASIPLLVGSNTVTINAYDKAGNHAWRSVVVTRN